MTRTRTLERLWSWPSEVPTSKYSISSDVCEGNFLRRVLPPPPWGLVGVVVLMVMGVPSSGTEYEVLSVRLETFVETFVSISSMWMDSGSDSSVESRVEDSVSVGAGRGGLSVSKPIVESERFLEGGVGERRHARHRFPRIRGREKK